MSPTNSRLVAWLGGEPALDLGVLVGVVVVDDEVGIEFGMHVAVDVPEEAQKLLVAVARQAATWIRGHLARSATPVHEERT